MSNRNVITEADLIAARRESVKHSYESAVAINRLKHFEGDVMATSEYVYSDQAGDSSKIVDMFYDGKLRVVSVQKKVKLGADGLMIYLATLLATHPDDTFVINPANIRIITGMSNVAWERDMKAKSPTFLKDKIFHHGQLKHAKLRGVTNGLIIIDEVDVGDKEFQELHKLLDLAGLLDIDNLVSKNNRFVLISATMLKTLRDLHGWGELHGSMRMTIPPNYIGHKDFLDAGIVKEFYAMNTPENVDRWIREDILERYRTDYRVHLVRGSDKHLDIIRAPCERAGIYFRKNICLDKMSEDEECELYEKSITGHVVLGVIDLLRRANLIPNPRKLRIGAVHEQYVGSVDISVQIQGLVGRMCGYWRDIVIDEKYLTGPYRTSIQAIEEYEAAYADPYGPVTYQAAGFRIRDGVMKTTKETMLSAKHVKGLDPDTTLEINQEKEDAPKTVPVVINLSEEEFKSIKRRVNKKTGEPMGVGNAWNYAGTIFPIIQARLPEIVPELVRISPNGKGVHVVQPERPKNYKDRVIRCVNAASTGTKCWILPNGVKDPNTDMISIYLDKLQFRIIILIYHGSMNA